jgi:hypothetical protein
LCQLQVGARFPLTPVVSATVCDLDGQRAIGVLGTEPITLRCSMAFHGVPIVASGSKVGHLKCLLMQKRIVPPNAQIA